MSIKGRILKQNNSAEDTNATSFSEKVSVIIPARNEERNIAKILSSLVVQSVQLHEIIVVNDNSTDNTAEIVKDYSLRFKNVKLINLKDEPPSGWVGKSWAIWNGVQGSTGDVLIFFDADVEPGIDAVQVLLTLRSLNGGLISVWPYQRFEKVYEHLGMVSNFMAIYASNNFEFLKMKPSGAFGPVIVTSRQDYERTGGHEAIKDSVLEDIKLGRLYLKHGIPVKNYLGGDIIKFRMYPEGLKQLFEGFTKNMSAGAITGGLFTFLIAFLWMAGMYSSVVYLFNVEGLWKYFVLAVIVYILSKPTGDYRWYDAIFYPIHFFFFLIVFLASLYKTLFIRRVKWRGREVSVK
ncbi:glycosyl transferase [Fervidobacterium thailandense]|uniref:Glycosyl transferase n=2 Tax=Fervidobacterium thailandense TaxID=1008305 RepID=A0A1E3G164_9BACT|nr:glycosyl transferase [Fervidobacterium thailandense]